MYVGRIVGVGRTPQGTAVAAYRISSRSFPNREIRVIGTAAHVVPRAGSADAASASPYIAYECLVWNAAFTVVGNGSQVRPNFERLKAGHGVRDAMLGVLAGLDREFDAEDTPRICGVIDHAEGRLWLGAVTADALSVRPMEVAPGEMAYVATYGLPLPEPGQKDPRFAADDAAGACAHLLHGSVFAGFTHPVCAAAALMTPGGPVVAVLNP